MAKPVGRASGELITLAVRYQVLIERLKSAEVAKFLPFLQEAERALQMRILDADISEFERGRVARLLDSIEDDLRGIFGRYTTQLTGDLIDTAVLTAQTEGTALAKLGLAAGFEIAIPTIEQVRAAVLSAPLSAQDYNAGKLLEPWLEGWTDAQIELVNGVIRQGYYQGLSTPEIIRRLRGTAKQRYKDGTLAQIQRSDTIVVRTAVQHAANVAREELYDNNDDIITGVEWVSALDVRTTAQCRSLDGRRFPLREGPRPPLHPGCRSTTIPLIDDAFDILDAGATRASKGADGGAQVDAKQTYYEWLKTQPNDFQDAAIGIDRAKLLRDGGLSAKRFAELQLNSNFDPLTLDELRDIIPSAFANAGL